MRRRCGKTSGGLNHAEPPPRPAGVVALPLQADVDPAAGK